MSRVLGSARDLSDLISLLAERRRELGLPLRAVDFIAGLADGHAAKLECGTKNLGHVSLPALLGAYGLHLQVVAIDDEIPAVTRRHMGARRGILARAA